MSKEKSSIPAIIGVVIGMNVFIGIVHGIGSYFTNGSFLKGFLDQSGWIIYVIGGLVILTILLFLFGHGENRH